MAVHESTATMAEWPASRAEARRIGAKFYFTGNPCPNGHVGLRYRSGGCLDCRPAVEAASRAKHREKRRAYCASWYAKNRALQAELSARWRAANRAQKTALERARKARKRSAEGSHTLTDIADIARAQNHRCAYCRRSVRKRYEVDHITPLVRGGSDDRSNLQILCPTCNRRKQAMDPIDFAQRIGLLL